MPEFRVMDKPAPMQKNQDLPLPARVLAVLDTSMAIQMKCRLGLILV